MTPSDERVLLLAPTAKDAIKTRQVFAGIGVGCTSCTSVIQLCEQIAIGASTLVLTEHATRLMDIQQLIVLLRNQPPWSDLPVVVLAREGANSPIGRQAMDLFGNVTVLERPVQMASLASVVRTLNRSRQRQYQIREHLQERERAAEQMRQSERLREKLLVSERTARNEAERISRVKDEFLATLSHELRTPLNAILGWSQILSRTVSPKDELVEGLQVIERNARAQARIIEDLLDMSRILNGKVRLEVKPIELQGVLNAALETISPAAAAKQIKVSRLIDLSEVTVAGDANRLQQVFWNLLSNAIKFTPKLGQVEIVLQDINGQVEIRVVDSGEGIRPDFLPHVFDRFRQADASTTRYHGGLGLGLAIVKQLVELHGGTVDANSAGPGRGSTFIVRLPLSVEHRLIRDGQALAPSPRVTLQPNIPSGQETDLSGLRVLVVDDEPDARMLIKRVLEAQGACVATCASARDAVCRILDRPPDLLISDVGMPGNDGYSLIREIRSMGHSDAANIPAIAVTAYVRSEDRLNAIQAGFQLHLPKPIEPGQLIELVASLTGRTSIARNASASLNDPVD